MESNRYLALLPEISIPDERRPHRPLVARRSRSERIRPHREDVNGYLPSPVPPVDAATFPDRWLTTVLFTDVVDSTRKAARLGDTRWLELEQTHECLVRREVRRFRGRVLGAAGDGFVAAFPSPAAAVRCATSIGAGTRVLGLDVRAGLHAGECERHGRHLGGIVFHIGARVAALASGGEVLVSHTVKDLVVGSGLSFAARGVRQLRGVPGRWPLYAATVPSCGPDVET